MATIKSYTDLSQSKKLAEILPLESADMHYPDYYFDGNAKGPCNTPYKEAIEDLLHVYINPKTKRLLPCWSLAALLKTLSFPSLTQNKEDEWEVCVFDHDNDDYIEKTASNPVDTCYEMIITLHKVNLL